MFPDFITDNPWEDDDDDDDDNVPDFVHTLPGTPQQQDTPQQRTPEKHGPVMVSVDSPQTVPRQTTPPPPLSPPFEENNNNEAESPSEAPQQGTAYEDFQKFLKQPQCQAYVNKLQDWIQVDCLGYDNKDELAEQLHRMLLECTEGMGKISNIADCGPSFIAALRAQAHHTDPLQWLLLECLERFVCSRMLGLTNVFQRVMQNELKFEKTLRRKIEWIRIWLQPKFLDLSENIDEIWRSTGRHNLKYRFPVDIMATEIKPLEQSFEQLFSAQLRILDEGPSPRAKLTAITNLTSIANAIAGELFVREEKDPNTVAADDLLPILVWGFIRSSFTPSLIYPTELVNTFRHPLLKEGSQMYCLTMTQAATEFLRRMRVFRDLRVESVVVRKLIHRTCPKEEMEDWLGDILEPVNRDTFPAYKGNLPGATETSMPTELQFSLSVYGRFLELLQDPSCTSAVSDLKRYVASVLEGESQHCSPNTFHGVVASVVRQLVQQKHLITLSSLTSKEADCANHRASFETRLNLILLLTECVEKFLTRKLKNFLLREAGKICPKPNLSSMPRSNLLRSLLGAFGMAVATSVTFGSRGSGSFEEEELSKQGTSTALEKAVKAIGESKSIYPLVSSDVERLVIRRLQAVDSLDSPRDVFRLCTACIAVAGSFVQQNSSVETRRIEVVSKLAYYIIEAGSSKLDLYCQFAMCWRNPILLDNNDIMALKLIRLACQVVIAASSGGDLRQSVALAVEECLVKH